MSKYQTTPEIHAEMARLRKLLRERKRQALGLPSSKKRTFTKDGHEYLYGVAAHFWRRLEIYRRAGGDVALIDGTSGDFESIEDLRTGMCEGCAETHPVGWNEGEWHHDVKTKGGRRCDCLSCGLWVCKPFHRLYHNRLIKWRQPNG